MQSQKPNTSNESRPISPQKNPAENCVLTINHGLADRIGAEPRSLGFDTRQYFMVLRPQCRTVAVAFAGLILGHNGVTLFLNINGHADFKYETQIKSS